MKTFTPESDARRAAAERVERLENELREYYHLASHLEDIQNELVDAKEEFERLFWVETKALDGVRK